MREILRVRRLRRSAFATPAAAKGPVRAHSGWQVGSCDYSGHARPRYWVSAKEKKRRKRCSQVPPARLAELTESLKAFARKVQGFGNRCERGLLTDAWLIERQLASPVMLYKVVADINIKS
jgi:hypothetical protein